MSDCPLGACTCPPRPTPTPYVIGFLDSQEQAETTWAVAHADASSAAALEARAVAAEARLAEALAREAQCCRWRDPRLEPPPEWAPCIILIPGPDPQVSIGRFNKNYGWQFLFRSTPLPGTCPDALDVALWMPLPAPPAAATATATATAAVEARHG